MANKHTKRSSTLLQYNHYILLTVAEIKKLTIPSAVGSFVEMNTLLAKMENGKKKVW